MCEGENKSTVKQEVCRLGNSATTAQLSLCLGIGEGEARTGERVFIFELGSLFLSFQYEA